MQGSLGEKIGAGATADIHAWAPGPVLKLFLAGITPRFGKHEARMIRAVFAAGAPALAVFDEVTLDGRFGIVLQRLDGPTLVQLLRTHAMTFEQAGTALASLYISIHGTPPPPALPSLRDWFDYMSRVPDAIPKHIATGILTLIERLPPEEDLCHGDLHPNNVIMTAEGPRAIDWVCAIRAPAAYDLARCHLLLCELVPKGMDPERPRALNAAVQSEYARLTGMSPAALTAAMELCLPIVRACALAERVWSPGQRERLIQLIEATLRSRE